MAQPRGADLRRIGHHAGLRAGRGGDVESLLRGLLRAAGSGRHALARGGPVGAGLAAMRGIDLGFVQLDERPGGGIVPGVVVVRGTLSRAGGAEQDDLVRRHARHPDVLFGDVADRFDLRGAFLLRRRVGDEGAAAEIVQPLAEALHLRLNTHDVRLELVRHLRADRPRLVAQRSKPVTHLIQHARDGSFEAMPASARAP